jgi:hypothetical protein
MKTKTMNNLTVLVSSLRLPDGLTRRGDINLLMLGDPGTAKSQLLKFVERCSPIGVSTSVWMKFDGNSDYSFESGRLPLKKEPFKDEGLLLSPKLENKIYWLTLGATNDDELFVSGVYIW